MIESSMIINDRMPEYCVERAIGILNRAKKALNGSRVLIMGVTYKQDIDDYRESPAFKIIEILRRGGARVDYYDPWVPECHYKGHKFTCIPAFNGEVVEGYDLVIITTGHTNVDYKILADHAQMIFDTRNAMKDFRPANNIVVL
jgi:UDP-N-acetyl-D-glucosamine dehydrogenase